MSAERSGDAFRPPYRYETSEHGPVTIYDAVDVGWIARVKESLPHKEALAQAIVDGLNEAAGYEVTMSEEEWRRAYDEALQWRDWQTCDQLLEEREQADWYQEAAERLNDAIERGLYCEECGVTQGQSHLPNCSQSSDSSWDTSPPVYPWEVPDADRE